MFLVDTHCHLADERFAGDRREVIAAARAAGIGMLAVGVDLASSRFNLELAASHSGVLAAVGIHPTNAGGLNGDDWRRLRELAASPLASAIGETGLDHHWKNVPAGVQKLWFERHIELALAVKKPLLVHARDSIGEVLAMLEPCLASGLAVVWHCFSAGRGEIRAALDFSVAHGIRMAAGGLVTFEDRKSLRACLPGIPDELLLLETDAPYLPPRPRISSRNEPARLPRIAEAVAELRQRSPADIARLTTGNAEKLFPGFVEGRS
ncbi:MAG: TatD family hydrolase [Planctomycetota bacterium]|jgi:TatD DNase family protein|nr:TatD family hydrolase [Planctomycetota bacterium]